MFFLFDIHLKTFAECSGTDHSSFTGGSAYVDPGPGPRFQLNTDALIIGGSLINKCSNSSVVLILPFYMIQKPDEPEPKRLNTEKTEQTEKARKISVDSVFSVLKIFAFFA